MTETFKNVYDFLHTKLLEIKNKGHQITSKNVANADTLKSELLELPHQFFVIQNPTQCIFNLNSFKTQPWWFVGEILTEFLNLNPPLMTRYRKDLIDASYKLMSDGTVEYMYGSRWKEFNQIDNVRKKLLQNPTSKRCIISTWMPYDTQVDRNETPCNVNYIFLPRDGKLDMTATIRSNDIMRGTKYDYPLASFMQQMIASTTNLKCGELYFHINSLHMYTKDRIELEQIVNELENVNITPIELRMPQEMRNILFWTDLRHVKKAEEASYNSAFEYANKHVNDMHYPIFRDYARILILRNAITAKHENAYEHVKRTFETDEIKKWIE